jgi:hypothetical protein
MAGARRVEKVESCAVHVDQSSSEPGVRTGSGASHVSWSLDGCANSLMTSAFINGSERLPVCVVCV